MELDMKPHSLGRHSIERLPREPLHPSLKGLSLVWLGDGIIWGRSGEIPLLGTGPVEAKTARRRCFYFGHGQ